MCTPSARSLWRSPHPDGTFFRTLHKDKWGRVRIKHAAANHAFDMVRRYLTGLPVEIEENR